MSQPGTLPDSLQNLIACAPGHIQIEQQDIRTGGGSVRIHFVDHADGPLAIVGDIPMYFETLAAHGLADQVHIGRAVLYQEEREQVWLSVFGHCLYLRGPCLRVGARFSRQGESEYRAFSRR